MKNRAVIAHILLSIFFFGIFALLIWKIRFFRVDVPRWSLLLAFVLKVVAGLALWVIYSYHHGSRETGDAFRYFDDAMVIRESLNDDPEYYLRFITGIGDEGKELAPYHSEMTNWKKPYNYGTTNDNRTIIRMNALIGLFSFGYYHVHTLFFCFFSMVGLTALFKAFRRILKDKKWGLYFACFLLPSVLFWGSGVLKEGLLLLGLGLFFYVFVKGVYEGWNLQKGGAAILLFGFLFLIKMYVLVTLLPGLIAWWVVKNWGRSHVLVKFLGIHLVLGLLVFNVHRVGVNYQVFDMLQNKQEDFYNQARIADSGSLIETTRLEDPQDLFFAAPSAIFNSLYRPHLFEMRNKLYVMPALENMFLLLVLLIPVFAFKKPPPGIRPVLYAAISFVILLACLIGWVTPILGALVRYKVPLLPFYIFIIVVFTNKEKLERKVPVFRKLPS